MHTIELADGTKLEGLELSGNNFISNTPLTPEMFPAGKLKHVIITADPVEREAEDGTKYTELPEMTGEYDSMKLIYAGDGGLLAPGKFRLILGEYSPAELEQIKTDSRIEYLSMMTGVDM